MNVLNITLIIYITFVILYVYILHFENLKKNKTN